MAAATIISDLRAVYHRNWLCYVTPTLTLYLQEPPTRLVAQRIIGAFREFCPMDRFRFVSGGDAPAFVPLDEAHGRSLAAEVLGKMDRRKDVGLVVWDGMIRESWSITIQGVPSRGGIGRASFCHLIFPNDVEPEVLLRLACSLADEVEFLSGHAGLGAIFNAQFKASAFDRIFGWAKRYPGLEVEDLNLTLPLVLDRIKGASWLTLVGSALAARLGPVSASEVEVIRVGHGVVLRAGPAPRLGDRNRMDWPMEVASVERALAGVKIESHPEFTGRFAVEKATWPWLNRFLNPDGW
jgi:hypothetical protein